MYIYILYIYIYTYVCIYNINNNLTWLGHGMSWICGEIWKFLKDFTRTGLNGGDFTVGTILGGLGDSPRCFLGSQQNHRKTIGKLWFNGG